VFAAYLHNAGAHEIAELRLGKKTEQLYAQGRDRGARAAPRREGGCRRRGDCRPEAG